MLKQYTLISLFVLFTASMVAQNTVEDYVNAYSKAAVGEMQRTGIPASILLAQGILESSFGNSQLAIQANNHFKLPCNNDWDGEFFYQWKKSKKSQRPSCYRVYSTPEESFLEYANLILKNDVFSSLTRLNSMNYRKWIKAIVSQNFSSKSNAEVQLESLIKEFQLAAFDNLPSQRSKRPVYNREIHDVNGLKAIVVSKDDSPLSIASEFDMPLRKILKYNDLKQGDIFRDNQFIFLESKRRRSKERREYHILNKDETLYDVSQMYGIQIKALCELNRVNYSDKIAEGEKINLIYAVTVPPRLEHEAPIKRIYDNELPGNGDYTDDVVTNDLPGGSDLPNIGNVEEKPPKKKVNPIKPYVKVEPLQKPKTDKPADDIITNPTPEVLPKEEVVVAPKEEEEEIAPPAKPRFKKEYEDDEITNGYIEKPPYPIPGKKKSKEKELQEPPNKPVFTKPSKKKLKGAPVPIIEANPTDEGMLSEEVSDAPPGGKVRLKLKDSEAVPVEREGYHIVEKGETLYRISKKHNVSVQQIIKWNNLKDINIEVNQELKIKE